MAEIVKDLFVGMPWYMYVLLVLSFGLMVASFILPPTGAIAPSVLQGVAELLGFGWLFYTTVNIPVFIQRGAKISAKYKDVASIEITKKEQEGEN